MSLNENNVHTLTNITCLHVGIVVGLVVGGTTPCFIIPLDHPVKCPLILSFQCTKVLIFLDHAECQRTLTKLVLQSSSHVRVHYITSNLLVADLVLWEMQPQCCLYP